MPAFPTPVASFPAISFDRPALDPLCQILRAYDRAIDACESFDHVASRRAIGLLRRSLELDTPEARTFDALYQWCEETVDARDFIRAARCLRSLRDAWHRSATPRTPTPRADCPVS